MLTDSYICSSLEDGVTKAIVHAFCASLDRPRELRSVEKGDSKYKSVFGVVHNYAEKEDCTKGCRNLIAFRLPFRR